MNSCCGSQGGRQELKVHGCFDRGLQTRRLPDLPVAGAPIVTASGLWASFSMQLDADELIDLRFKASACTTLIAYCQALVELSRHDTLSHAATLDSATLIHCLSGVPVIKHDRAVLAAAALRSAVVAAERTITSTTGVLVA